MAVLTLTGAGFDDDDLPCRALASRTGSTLEGSVEFISSTTLQATFHIEDGKVPGIYSMPRHKGNRSSVTLRRVRDRQCGPGAARHTNLVVPSSVNPGFPVKQTLWVEYSNAGDLPMPAPLLQVVADGKALLTTSEDLANSLVVDCDRCPTAWATPVQVLGTGSGATPGILQPGDSGRIPVYYIGQSKDEGASRSPSRWAASRPPTRPRRSGIASV